MAKEVYSFGPRSEKAYQFWHNYLPKLAEQLQLHNLVPVPISSRQCTVYQAFTWVFLAALLILFIILLATVLVMRKRNSKSKAKAASQSVFSVSARSYGGESSIREDSLQPTSPREAAPNFSNFPAQKISAPIFPAQSYPSPDFVDRRRSTKHQWRESVTDYRL